METDLKHVAAPRQLTLYLGALIGCLMVVLSATARAADGDLDLSFDPGAGIGGGTVYSTIAQPDGKIIIGGSFSSYNGTARRNIVRVNADGSLDTSFNPGAGPTLGNGGLVWELALQPDGKVLIGGDFNQYNGVARNHVARLNSDGSLDASFDPGAGPSGGLTTIRALALQSDGKILVGGGFTTFNGVAKQHFVRLNSDGSVDGTFNPGGSGAAFETYLVFAIAIQPDGRIVIAGNFLRYNGVARRCIARLNPDGLLDDSFNPGVGPNGNIRAVALQGTSIIIGGDFSAYNGATRSRIARLNADGSLDDGFTGGAGANSNVDALAVLHDGRIAVGGSFTTFDGAARTALVRLNDNGTLDSSFGSAGGGFAGDGDVKSIAVQADERLVVGGQFTRYNGVVRSNIARILSNPPPPPPAPRRLWVAGGDLYDNEIPDAAKETNASNSTVPQWSYGYRQAVVSSDLIAFTNQQHTNGSNAKVPGATASSDLHGWDPDAVLLANTTKADIALNYGSGTLRPLVVGQMLLHPSAGTVPVARWKAPATARYNIVAKWLDLDTRGGNGASAHVLVNGQERFAAEWNDGGGVAMRGRPFDLNENDVVDFVAAARGDHTFDATAFNAAIAIAPTVSIGASSSSVAEGDAVTITADVQHSYPIRTVTLKRNGGQVVAHDDAAPYEFVVPGLSDGTHYFDAVAIDDAGVETLSNRIVVSVSKAAQTGRRTKAAATAEQKTEAAEDCVFCGVDYIYFGESGNWSDPNNWLSANPGTVPGPEHRVLIGEVTVTLTEPVTVKSLVASGTQINGIEFVGDSLSVTDYIIAHGGMSGLTLNIPVGATFYCFLGELVLNNVTIDNRGATEVSGLGAISKVAASTMVGSGRLALRRAHGLDRVVTAEFDDVQLPGGLTHIDRDTRLVAGELVAAGGLNLVGNAGGTLVGNAGGTLIGADGATLVGNAGGTLIGADGATLVGNAGGTLIGADGATLVGNAGGTLVGNAGGTFTRASARAATAASNLILESGATLTGTGRILMNVTNTGGFIAPGNSAGAFEISGDFTQQSGGTLVVEAGGTQPAQYDQLRISGGAQVGGTLVVKTTDGYTPQPGDAFKPLTYSNVNGQFENVSPNAQVNFGPDGMTMQVSGPNPPAPKALNIATRMRVETGDNVLIAGFIITGSQPKKVLVRGIGPSLPVEGALADPTLDLDAGTFFNDDWRSDQQGEIEATTIPPSSDLESAIVATLEPGAHTAVLRGKNNGTGVGLVEVYDLESGTPVQLANISTRGQVQTGDNVMIGGFIIDGDYPAKVLLRAIGPSLPVDGALQDPTLELVDSNGSTITNDNWRETQEAEIVGTTVPPTDDNEAAIVATLVPGAYTAVVRGKGDTIGVALVEGYNLQ